MTLKIAVFAPMPRPSVSTNARANPGTRVRFRNAMRMSLIMGRVDLGSPRKAAIVPVPGGNNPRNPLTRNSVYTRSRLERPGLGRRSPSAAHYRPHLARRFGASRLLRVHADLALVAARTVHLLEAQI